MRVLITGGYGFIGSFVAERFYKEGHSIYILDDLSTGREENIGFAHKAWILDIADRKCEEIFKANSFDVVIHLAAQVEVGKSFADPVDDTERNIVGLVNMLSLSQKYKVGKFLFASSAAVYGESLHLPIPEDSPLSPQSPYGLNKLAGEYYCEKWSELFGLNTVVLRFSNVFGPGQSAKGESGVISCFFDQIMKNKPLTVFGDGTQTRDFIYVSDVAEAIYRSILSDARGIFNLSSHSSISLNELISTIQTFAGVKETVFLPPKAGDIKDSCLDHSKLAEVTGWKPKYGIQEGLKKTYDWHVNRKDESLKISNDRTSNILLSLKQSRYLPFAENLFVFVSLFSFSQLLGETTAYDLFLVYIFTIGLLLGKNQAFLAVLFSSYYLVSSHLNNGREIVSVFTDYGILLQFAVLLLVGLVSGYVMDRRRIREEKLQDDLDELKEKYDFLEDVHQDTRQNKDMLQRQIFQTEDSVGRVYEVIASLDSLESMDVINGAVKAVEKLMKVNKVAVYHVNEGQEYLRLAGKSGEIGFEVPRSISAANHPFYQKIIYEKKVIMDEEWETGSFVMAAPIINGDKVIAVIQLHEPEFDSLTLHYQNLLTVISRLISSALARGHEYESATFNSRYISGSRILKPDVFNKMLEKREQMRKEMNIPYALLEVPWSLDLKLAIENISSQLREIDFIGSDEEGKILVLLSNTTDSEVDFVIERLKRQQIEVVRAKNEEMLQYA